MLGPGGRQRVLPETLVMHKQHGTVAEIARDRPRRVGKMLLLFSGIFIVAVVVIALHQLFIFWNWGE